MGVTVWLYTDSSAVALFAQKPPGIQILHTVPLKQAYNALCDQNKDILPIKAKKVITYDLHREGYILKVPLCVYSFLQLTPTIYT